MKKFIPVLLMLTLSFTLSACGNSAQTPDNLDDESSGSQANEEIVKTDETEITFSEQVLVDTEDVKVTATALEPDNMWGYTVKLLLENKSDSITYMYAIDTATVDGVETAPLFANEVAPGMKANEEVNFTDGELDALVNYTDIMLRFRIYDNDDWSADEAVKADVHIYPFGEDKVSLYKRTPQETDTVLIDNDAVLAVITGYDEDSMWGYSGKLFIENKTDKSLAINVDKSSINGFMIDPFFGTIVSPGACKFTSIDWPSSELEDNGIEEIQEIQFTFKASEDVWDGETYYEDIVTLHP